MRKHTTRDFIIALILLLAAFVTPTVGALEAPMLKTIFLIAFSIFLWIQKPIPIGMTSLLVIILMPLLGLTETLSAAFSGFSTPSNYFVIASFGVAIAIRKTSIPGRILNWLLSVSNGDYRKIILAYMVMTYIISTIMSDITAVMIALAFGMDLLDELPDVSQQKKLGRGLLLSLPLASIIGGTATPAGSTVNVMALNILNTNTGLDIPFLEWCLLAFPISIVMLFIAWFMIIKFYPAENMSAGELQLFLDKKQPFEKIVASEKRLLAVLIFMIIAWIAGTWIKPLNTTTVAVIGLTLMFLPGVNAFSWKEFTEGVHWEIFLMGGTAISLGNLARQTGIVSLLAEWCQNNFTDITEPVLIAIIGVIVTLVLIVIPVGPATVSMLTLPVYMMAEALHINPIIAVVTIGIFASNSSILPLNSVMLLSYTKGYWKTSEMTRIGILISVCWIILAALWIPFAAKLIL